MGRNLEYAEIYFGYEDQLTALRDPVFSNKNPAGWLT